MVLHDLGFHYNVSVLGIYTLTSGSRTDYDRQLLTAISQAIVDHPNLWLQIRQEASGNPYFARLPEIDVEDAVTFSKLGTEEGRLEHLGQMLSQENSIGFTAVDAPLWRIRIVDLGRAGLDSTGRQFALVFVYHHAIADGKSGVAMHNSILEHLNRLTPDAETKTTYAVHPPANPLLPDMDELIDYTPTWKAKMRAVLLRLTPCLRRDFRLEKWSGAPYHHNPAAGSRTNVRLLELSNEETRTVHGRCQAEKCSVTSMLQVLVGTTIFDHFQNAQSLRCASAISLRRFLPPSSGIDDSKIGLWIDGFSDTFTRRELAPRSTSDGLSWDAARRSKRHINQEIAKGLSDLGFSSLHGGADFRSMLLRQLGNPRTNSYSIINLGVFEASFPSQRSSDGQLWSLERLLLSQSAHINGSAIQFCFVSTERAGMGISVNYQEGTVVEKDVDTILASLRQKISHIGQA